jgi:hypothetical protein
MKKYQNGLSRSIHTMVESCYKAGLIDSKEMHEYDEAFLVPSAVPLRETTSYSGDSQPTAPIPAVAVARA